MTIPNKEIIQAYLDGKDIQYRLFEDTSWTDFSKNNACNPMQHDIYWRIKPNQAELDYNRFEARAFTGDGTSIKEAYMQGWIDGNLAGKKELTGSKT